MCCPLVFEFSVGIGGFVIGLGQISFFFSLLRILSYYLRHVVGQKWVISNFLHFQGAS